MHPRTRLLEPVAPRKLDEVSTTRTVYARVITDTWQKIAADIVGVGRCLIEAKAELPHGEWLLLVEHDLPFGARTAQRLMKIAQDPVLSDATHGSLLPASWRTLDALASLPRPTLEAAIESGTITPKMSRRDVARLHKVPDVGVDERHSEGTATPRHLCLCGGKWGHTQKPVRCQSSMLDKTLGALENYCDVFDRDDGVDIDFLAIDATGIPEWVAILEDVEKRIRRVKNRLRAERR